MRVGDHHFLGAAIKGGLDGRINFVSVYLSKLAILKSLRAQLLFSDGAGDAFHIANDEYLQPVFRLRRGCSKHKNARNQCSEIV
jgi:hypothetical protein